MQQAKQVKQGQNRLNALLNPLVSKTKEDVVLAVGAPNSVEMIGNIEVYRYFQIIMGAFNAMIFEKNCHFKA